MRRSLNFVLVLVLIALGGLHLALLLGRLLGKGGLLCRSALAARSRLELIKGELKVAAMFLAYKFRALASQGLTYGSSLNLFLRKS